MAKNQQLEDVVLVMMAEQLLERDPALNLIADGEIDMAKAVIQSMGTVGVDKKYKFRTMYQRYIGYGYDFDLGNETSKSTKQVFEDAVRNTRERVLGENGETLLYDLVKDNKFGLYLTQI